MPPLDRKQLYYLKWTKGGLNHPCLSDLLNAKALFQLLSLGPGRTPYSHTFLLPYTAPVPRKPVPGWAQGHPRWSPGRQHPSECHLGADPYDTIRDSAPGNYQNPPSDAHMHLCPSDPQSQGKTPKKRRNTCQNFQHRPWGIFGRTTIA